MSFILDALKKSENERQQQAATEFATIPSAAASPSTPRWIWVLMGLLVVNIGIVAVAMLRPAAEPAATVGSQATESAVSMEAAPAAATSDTSFAERISAANVPRPAPSRASNPEHLQSTPRPAPQVDEPGPQRVVDSGSSLALPTLNEVRLDNSVSLPDLHLDIHVYSDAPADRFVFINMQKHQEGSVLEAGPRVDEITPDGVVLDYRGTRFVLPRE